MAKSNERPSEEELEKRRKPKFIIDPKDVSEKDQVRMRMWAAEVMRKHEHLMNNQIADRKVVMSGDVRPEEIDIMNIYPFKNLNWIIYRKKTLFAIMLLSGKTLLFESTFAKI